MDEKFMREALRLTEKCKDDVPIGAVVVKDGFIIGKGYNQKEKKNDATCHAEILAIKQASKKLKSYYLVDCDLYVTKEPCLMCYGAILSSRIQNVYYGCYDTKYPSVEIGEKFPFNHKANFQGGILEEECKTKIQQFFSCLRSQHVSNKDKNERN